MSEVAPGGKQPFRFFQRSLTDKLTVDDAHDVEQVGADVGDEDEFFVAKKLAARGQIGADPENLSGQGVETLQLVTFQKDDQAPARAAARDRGARW